MIVREAKFVDIPAISEFLDRAREGSIYDGLDLRHDRFRKWLYGMMMDSHTKVWVADGDGIHGVLVGHCMEMFGGPARFASDLLFVVDDQARSRGAVMLRRFLDWAEKVPNVARVWLQAFSGFDTSRTDQLYQRLGLALSGSIHSKEVFQ